MFNGKYYPGCESVGRTDPYDYLGCLLTDDGGLGLDHHIPWLQQGRKLCGNVLEGKSERECFTTECFEADISADGVWIYGNRSEPTSGIKVSLAGLTHVLDEWIEFLENGVKRDGVHVVIHAEI